MHVRAYLYYRQTRALSKIISLLFTDMLHILRVPVAVSLVFCPILFRNINILDLITFKEVITMYFTYGLSFMANINYVQSRCSFL